MTDNVSFNPNVNTKAPEMVEIKTKNGTFKVDSSIFDGVDINNTNNVDSQYSFDTVKLKNGVKVSLSDELHWGGRKAGDANVSVDGLGNIIAENAGHVDINSQDGLTNNFDVTAKNSKVAVNSDYDYIRTKTEGNGEVIIKPFLHKTDITKKGDEVLNKDNTSIYKETPMKFSEKNIAKKSDEALNNDFTSIYKSTTSKCLAKDVAKTELQPQPTPAEKLPDDPSNIVIDD